MQSNTPETATPPQLDFNPAHQDAWEQLQNAARAIRPMPHFWAAGAHAGVLRRKELKYGYDLMQQSVGGFGAWFVACIPFTACLVFALTGFAAGMGADFDRPGGIVGKDCAIIAGQLVGDHDCDLSFTREAEWPVGNTLFITVILAGVGYLMGYYIWQPSKWYNAAWGDTLILEERNGAVSALVRTKLHRLAFVNHQALGYYRGNARDGHISRARMLLKYTPPTLDAEGNVTGKGAHPKGLATALMQDLYEFDPGTGHSTDDPGKAYEAKRVQIKIQADKARALSQRGYNRFLKIDTVVYILAGILVLTATCNMAALTGGGEAVLDPGVVGDTIGLGGN